MAADELESEEIHHMYQIALAGAAYEMDRTTVYHDLKVYLTYNLTRILQLSPVMYDNNATGCFDSIICLAGNDCCPLTWHATIRC
jgi:hypothetical protein